MKPLTRILFLSLFISHFLSGTVVLFVSPEGNDDWTGRYAEPLVDGSDGPLASLAVAQSRLRDILNESSREREPGMVILRGGEYRVTESIQLGPGDSGIAPAPIIWQAWPGEKVILNGGTRVETFRKLSENPVPARIPEAHHGEVYVADLRALGIDYPDKLARRTRYTLEESGPFQLFYRDRIMTLARYPNEGWVTIAGVPQGSGEPLNPGHHEDKRDGKVPTGRHYGEIRFGDERPSKWKSVEDVWMHGYWTWDWAESTQRMEKLDTQEQVIKIASPHHRYGYTTGQRYYYFNIPEELDSPGEWYLDRERGLLFFWPPEPSFSGEVVLSRLTDPVFEIEEAAHVTLRGFAFAYTRGAAVVVKDSEHIAVADCRFHCLGGRPVTVAGGRSCGVRDSVFTELATGAVFLEGGDRATLTPSNHFVVNNHIHDFAKVYRTIHPAIRLHGVGHRAAHNLIHNAPHMGLYFRGNDHLIEFNEIHDIAQETGDVGAIYTGRDYTARGTVIRYNYLHDLHGPGLHGVRGVYLDDFTSGIDVFGNVFYKAGRAAFIGGGRDNRIQNNVFVDCLPSVQIDGRGLSWAVHHFDQSHPRYASTLRDFYAAADVTEPPYSIRYPALIRLYEDEPRVPKYNVVENNLSFGGIFLDLYDGVDLELATVRDNLIADPILLRMSETSDQAPEFVIFRNGEAGAEAQLEGNILMDSEFAPFRIGKSGILFDIEGLPAGTGFLPIPMHRIGLQEKEH